VNFEPTPIRTRIGAGTLNLLVDLVVDRGPSSAKPMGVPAATLAAGAGAGRPVD
jgi:hypothetical protein